jgi:hypothetical protein
VGPEIIDSDGFKIELIIDGIGTLLLSFLYCLSLFPTLSLFADTSDSPGGCNPS